MSPLQETIVWLAKQTKETAKGLRAARRQHDHKQEKFLTTRMNDLATRIISVSNQALGVTNWAEAVA